jgi:type IV pilus assembly protein PilE
MAGFTLIELMVALVVAAVLILIAIPGYQSQIRSSRRTEAKTALLDLAGREETLFSTKNVYSNLPSDLGYGAVALPIQVGSYYQVMLLSPDPASISQPSFTITATPVAGSSQAQDAACQAFSVDQLGNQTALDSGGALNTKTCWGT